MVGLFHDIGKIGSEKYSYYLDQDSEESFEEEDNWDYNEDDE